MSPVDSTMRTIYIKLSADKVVFSAHNLVLSAHKIALSGDNMVL
jgi:hypothetical protein